MYYKPGKGISVLGILICIAVAIIASLIGGLTYVYASWFIPFIYVNFLLTLGYGFILGFAMDYAFKFGKVRGFAYQKGLAIIAGLIGLYVAWAIFVAVVTEASSPFEMLTKPLEVWTFIRLINVTGLWTIVGDSPVTGGFLWMVWIIEALMIVGVTFVKADESRPFCETSNQWMKETVLKPYLHISNIAVFRTELEQKNYATLRDLPRDRADTHHAKFTLYKSPQLNDYYLLAENVVIIVDKDGKTEFTSSVFIPYLKIDAAFAKELIAKG